MNKVEDLIQEIDNHINNGMNDQALHLIKKVEETYRDELIGENQHKFNMLKIKSFSLQEKYLEAADLVTILYNSINYSTNHKFKIELIRASMRPLWFTSKFDLIEKYLLEGIKLIDQEDQNLNDYDLEQLGAFYDTLALIYQERFDNKKAIKYWKLSHEIAIKQNDIENIGRTLNGISMVYKRMQDFENAQKYADEALNIARELDKPLLTSEILTNLSHIYMGQERYIKALENLEISLKIQREFGNRYHICASLVNLGDLKVKIREYEEGIKNFLEALELTNPDETFLPLSRTYQSLGIAYSYLGKYTLSEEYLLKALEFENFESKLKNAENHANLSILYNFQGNPHKAIEHSKKSIEIIGDDITPKLQNNHYEVLGYSYFLMANNEKSKDYLELAFQSARIRDHQQDLVRIGYNLVNVCDALNDKELMFSTRQKLESSLTKGNLELLSVYLTLIDLIQNKNDKESINIHITKLHSYIEELSLSVELFILISFQLIYTKLEELKLDPKFTLYDEIIQDIEEIEEFSLKEHAMNKYIHAGILKSRLMRINYNYKDAITKLKILRMNSKEAKLVKYQILIDELLHEIVTEKENWKSVRQQVMNETLNLSLLEKLVESKSGTWGEQPFMT